MSATPLGASGGACAGYVRGGTGRIHLPRVPGGGIYRVYTTSHPTQGDIYGRITSFLAPSGRHIWENNPSSSPSGRHIWENTPPLAPQGGIYERIIPSSSPSGRHITVIYPSSSPSGRHITVRNTSL